MLSLSKPIISLLLLILLGSLWGTGYSIAKFAMTNDVPPLGYSFWQSLGPAIIIGCLAFSSKKAAKTTISHWQYYLICGLTGIVIPNTTMYFAASHLPASILAMVVNTVPIIAYPLALLARLETFHWQRISGIAFAFFAILLIIFPKTSLPSPEMIPWVIITLLAPLSFAICSIYIACFKSPPQSILTQTGGMLLFSSILLTPLVLFTHHFYFFHWPLLAADWVIFLEIILSSIGYLLFFQLIKIAGPVYYSLVDTIVVLTGVFWGYILFGERLNQWTGTAVMMILFALLLVTQQQKKVSQLLSLAKHDG